MYAAIDIGTNSVLLLIADVHHDDLRALHQEARISRLGEGIGRTRLLAEHAIERTLRVLRDYAARCREAGVREIFACGTAALRKAANADAFIQRVRAATNIAVEVIGDAREALLSYRGSAASFGNNITVMDIGGGSTEFIAPRGDDVAAQSLDLGVVTMKEQLLRSDPPTEAEIAAARQHIRAALQAELDAMHFRQPDMKLVAAAGTATTLAAMHAGIDPYDPDRVHGVSLALVDVAGLIEHIRNLPAAAIKRLKGVQAGREDVILAGALVTVAAMRHLGYEQAIISDRGVRWGLLYEKLKLAPV